MCSWAYVGQMRSAHFALRMCTFSMWFKLGAFPTLVSMVFPASYAFCLSCVRASGFRDDVARNIDKAARLHMPAMFICT